MSQPVLVVARQPDLAVNRQPDLAVSRQPDLAVAIRSTGRCQPDLTVIRKVNRL